MSEFDTNGLANLLQQVSYYKAGGYAPGQSPLEKTNTMFGQLSNAGNLVADQVSKALALKKQQLENQTVGQTLGAPSAQAATNQQTTRVPSNIFPQPNAQLESGTPLPSGVQGPSQPQAIPTPAPIAPMAQQRQDIQSKVPVHLNTPMFQVPEMSNLMYKGAVMNNLSGGMAYQNPDDPSDVSPTPDSTHTLKMKSPQAVMLELKSKAQEQANELNDTRMRLLETKNDNDRQFMQQKLDNQTQALKNMTDRLQLMNDAITQRASTQFSKDTNSNWWHPWSTPDASSYRNASGGVGLNSNSLLDNLIKKHQ